MKNFELKADSDTYALVNLVKETLCVSEEKALAYLTEVGICNLINYPTGIKMMDDVIKKIPKFQELIIKMRAIWGMKEVKELKN